MEHPVPREREGDREPRAQEHSPHRTEAKDSESDHQSLGNTKAEPRGKNIGNTSRKSALTKTTVWRKQPAGPRTPPADLEKRGKHACPETAESHGGSQASPWLPAASALHPALQPAGRSATPSLGTPETRARPVAPLRPTAATSQKAQQTGRKQVHNSSRPSPAGMTPSHPRPVRRQKKEQAEC
ncbi:hypothetical protein NDU88_006880 [Pleurodeles waltl]|uniref:Uncharacterized protein n=1 Tax=Pleurodeles waltl TaxID=8319 RepID=A0AAV7QL98_PLEWA|nr:hypothetical protein NDU88_006880 [Pleurodeles waltl]